MVCLLSPHHWRMAALHSPHEVARLSLGPSPSAAAAAASKAGAAAAEAAAPPPAALPYVPEFFSFAAAIKQDARLLLPRGTDAAAAAATDAAPVDGWSALRSSALSSPSCLLSSLAFLFWGSPSWAPAAAAPPAAPVSLAPPPPAHLPAPAAAASVESGGGHWRLTTVPAGSSSGAAAAATGVPQLSVAEPVSRLDHAISIAAMLPLSRSSHGSFRASSSSSEGGDAGHLIH